ncbi:MAG: hypothetical protein GY794_25005, partial [bacterium]|nr:hypothetical protein [bacterium]
MLFETGGNDNGTSFYLDGAELVFTTEVSSEIRVDLNSIYVDPTAEFIQVIATIDLTNDLATLYLDGISRGTMAATGTDWTGGDGSGLGTVNNQSNVEGDFHEGNGNFIGDIAVFRFYESVLTPTEVTANYESIAGEAQVIEVNGNPASIGSEVPLASGALLTMNADGSFSYDPNGQFDYLMAGESTTDDFAYTYDDGAGSTDTATVSITINGVDDAIDTSTTGNTVTFTEDAGATSALFAASIDTIETGDTISEVILTLANVEAGDTLSFGATSIDLNSNGATGPDGNGFTYTISNAGTSPVITITHAGTDDATVNTMLNSAVFNNTSNNNPTTTARTVTFTSVTDSGSGTTADGTVATVNMAAINDAPTISNLAGDALAYSEGDRAVVIEQGADVAVTDADSTDFDSGTLTVSFAAGSDSAEDILAIRNQGYGTGEISVAGYGVAYEGTLIGSFTGGANGDDLVITLNASANPVAVQALIENITYENTDADNATTGARTVRFVLSDGDGGTSANYDTTVTVSAANHAPTF